MFCTPICAESAISCRTRSQDGLAMAILGEDPLHMCCVASFGDSEVGGLRARRLAPQESRSGPCTFWAAGGVLQRIVKRRRVKRAPPPPFAASPRVRSGPLSTRGRSGGSPGSGLERGPPRGIHAEGARIAATPARVFVRESRRSQAGPANRFRDMGTSCCRHPR